MEHLSWDSKKDKLSPVKEIEGAGRSGPLGRAFVYKERVCLWALCMSSLEVSVQVFCPFFNWIVCLLWVESCEFFINSGDHPLVHGITGTIYSHMVCSLYTLLMFSLAMQKLFILMKSHLFILSFMSIALGDILVKILLHGISEIFLLIFSSRTFMVSWLIFKSFIHLWVYSGVCKLVI